MDNAYDPPSQSLSERAQGVRARPPYMEGLNEAQLRAVQKIDGALLILAGAGTGKTRTLTTRLAHILFEGQARPHELLAVTFTNKAALEMKERVRALLGDGRADSLRWIGTFHSVCMRILRRHSELVGLKSDFLILDKDDQIRLLKQIITAHDIDEKAWPARLLAGIIDNFKNRAWTPQNVPTSLHSQFNAKAVKLYEAYQERLKTLNAVDFGDLLLFNVILLQKNPALLERYQQLFRYILVDEYQDTNVAQYLWLRLLAGGHQNICCVGDDDQAIYGWRGAEVGNILRFEKDFPGAEIVRLEENYRSNRHILTAASAVISGNQHRLGKTLFTQKAGGEKIRLISHWSDDDEARWIDEDINRLQRGRGTADGAPCALNEMAILVRATRQMRAFEDRFFETGTPYRVIGGARFYERAEVRDAIAYFRLAQNPNDDLAFMRVANLPRRGIGAGAMKKLRDYGAEHSLSHYEAGKALLAAGKITGVGQRGLQGFLSAIEQWHGGIGAHGQAHQEGEGDAEFLSPIEMVADEGALAPHVALAQNILDMSGYSAMWMNDKSPKAPERLENIKELTKNLANFENLAGFLEHVSLFMEGQSTIGEPQVSLMTLHGAKGLEFSVVYLPGWEDGLFPSPRAISEGGEKSREEERRLAYVGITRAREICTISFATARKLYGGWQSSLPSEFIDLLPAEHVDILDNDGMKVERTRPPSHTSSGYQSPGWQRLKERNKAGAHAPHYHPPPLPKKIGARGDGVGEDDFPLGSRVFHQKFGYGVVCGKDRKNMEIDFEHAGKKTIAVGFVVCADAAE